MEKDWRIVNQERYLYQKRLQFSEFRPSKRLDHVHCSFCWDKFGCETGMLQFGYCTEDQRWWICRDCYRDFADQFEWEVVTKVE